MAPGWLLTNPRCLMHYDLSSFVLWMRHLLARRRSCAIGISLSLFSFYARFAFEKLYLIICCGQSSLRFLSNVWLRRCLRFCPYNLFLGNIVNHASPLGHLPKYWWLQTQLDIPFDSDFFGFISSFHIQLFHKDAPYSGRYETTGRPSGQFKQKVNIY